ncbi:unnamed protein product [Caenorhabditis auriculariae]|uniref:DUF19 domain-containing protein n=1 Tax=Caenorhabditis auriculariae TaxID=2777116 RepID=A0A8S1HDE9_9PELO|nr:unnamed protein product [Caenorhabditis auriculariae]
MQSFVFYSILFFATVMFVEALPTHTKLPLKELCATYKKKCETKFNRNDCDQREIECFNYANQGIETTWSFCMQQNNDELETCEKRLKIDFQIIKEWVLRDQFAFVPN